MLAVKTSVHQLLAPQTRRRSWGPLPRCDSLMEQSSGMPCQFVYPANLLLMPVVTLFCSKSTSSCMASGPLPFMQATSSSKCFTSVSRHFHCRSCTPYAGMWQH